MTDHSSAAEPATNRRAVTSLTVAVTGITTLDVVGNGVLGSLNTESSDVCKQYSYVSNDNGCRLLLLLTAVSRTAVN